MSSFVKLLGASIVVTVACGGSTAPDNGNGNGSSGDTSGSPAGGSGYMSGTMAGGSGDTTGSMAGGGSGDMSGTMAGGSGAAASGTGMGGSGRGGSGRPGGGGPTDAGAPGPDTVPCGRTACQGATPVCCVGGRTDTCAASAADCATDAGRIAAVLECSGKATCMAGDVCCVGVQRDAGVRGGLLVTECLPQCASLGFGGIGEQVCMVNSDCPQGDTCSGPATLGNSRVMVCVRSRAPFDAGGFPQFDGGRRRPPRDAGGGGMSDSSAGNNDM
jgi:hypothetical protein